ncbi:hypothetical protein L1049_015226 [Liquidambar formosana]|uniref:MADS-box domain-containing protein n=1 Tax=Liquidambar formosana TaxID=63359 RepID=A0AAP0RXL1_LIQFO
MNKKSSKGRQKIEIKEIDKISNRQVTFSKRKAGLFKKATEISVLCGAEVAVIVFSQAKKLYSFGYPNADAVIDRYISGSMASEAVENYPPAYEFVKCYEEALKRLEEEKMRREMIEKSKKVGEGRFWWDEPIDNMGLVELEQYMESLQGMRKRVAMRYDELMMMEASSSSRPQFFANSTVANHVGQVLDASNLHCPSMPCLVVA